MCPRLYAMQCLQRRRDAMSERRYPTIKKTAMVLQRAQMREVLPKEDQAGIIDKRDQYGSWTSERVFHQSLSNTDRCVHLAMTSTAIATTIATAVMTDHRPTFLSSLGSLPLP
jgi:hypothetical protein